MQHPDEETLALLALGEHAAGAALAQHIAACPLCQAELAALTRVAKAGRARPGGGLEAPSDVVWARIADELGIEEGEAPPPADAGAPRAAPAPPAGPDAAVPGTAPAASVRDRRDGTTAGPPRAPALPGPARRPGRRDWWRRRGAWAMAASFLLGVAGTVGVQQLRAAPPPAETLARAELEPLAGWEGEGSAVVREVDGRRVLTVQLAVGAVGGFREVWLIDRDLGQLVSLGVLTGTEGRFELPEGLDLDEFAIVDVSDEPYDGDPAHSGDSIVRGELA
ncbi:anti-sigma factor domain-containing protein [Georgenia sp. AZ-5]|uniref:anti-sigma factor domain-containing protein n=1 Tax=Georgenia sp. AZ-5 TaxID=3367526 RepID=UPI003754959E